MSLEITLPDWAIAENEALPKFIPHIEQRMRVAIRFSRLNFENQTGGPFAAGIFEKSTGKVVLVGVNRVVPLNMSSAHAEIVAITLAQQKLKTFDLGGPDMPEYVGASGDQIEKLTGFDEGPIHPNWKSELEDRGIEVIEDVLADEACEVFRDFGDSDQPVYNGRSG